MLHLVIMSSNKKIRNTSAKSAILNLLAGSVSALSPAEILAALNSLCDRVTVYRVLDRLREEELVHKVVDFDGVLRFASCKSCVASNHQHNHIHFSCQKCKSVTCLSEVEPQLSISNSYKILQVNFTVSGICPSCIIQEE